MSEDLKSKISSLRGLFVGLLSEEEVKDFNAACEAGLAFRSYEGAGGLMGLATVRLIEKEEA